VSSKWEEFGSGSRETTGWGGEYSLSSAGQRRSGMVGAKGRIKAGSEKQSGKFLRVVTYQQARLVGRHQNSVEGSWGRVLSSRRMVGEIGGRRKRRKRARRVEGMVRLTSVK
jgi:hypothetical protein